MLLAIAASRADHTATFQGLGDLPGGDIYSTPRGMTSDGKLVVGLSKSASGYESFRWTAEGGITNLVLPDGKSATGISGDGTVLLGWDRFAAQSFSGSPDGAGFALVGDLPGGDNYSSGHGISADGSVIVGRGSSVNGTAEAFRWTVTEGITGLGDLPSGRFFSEANAVSADGTVIVGTGNVLLGTEAFRWTAQEGMLSLGDFPGGYTNGIAYGVSANGAVVVGRAYPGTFDNATHEAFFWTASAGMIHLGFADGDQDSEAYACSADGNTIVGDEPFRDSGYALIWQPGRGIRHLVDVLAESGLDLSGWNLTSAFLISNDGTVISGSGVNPAGYQEAWIATIPRFELQLWIQFSPPKSLVLSWPSPSSGWVLQSTGTLPSQQTTWQPVTASVSDDGSTRCVTLECRAVPQYFRLFR